MARTHHGKPLRIYELYKVKVSSIFYRMTTIVGNIVLLLPTNSCICSLYELFEHKLDEGQGDKVRDIDDRKAVLKVCCRSRHMNEELKMAEAVDLVLSCKNIRNILESRQARSFFYIEGSPSLLMLLSWR